VESTESPEAPLRLQVYGETPPEAVNVPERLAPDTTLPIVVGPLRVSGVDTILRDSAAVALARETESLTVTLILPLKAADGVPLRLPVLLRPRPGGKALADQEYEPDPPVAVRNTGP
jgi:hypothetical protein